MPPSRAHIRHVVESYLARHPEESASLTVLRNILAGLADPTHRKTLPAHVTCSAVLIDPDNRVLHIHHKASGKALAPGGHNEPSDTDLMAAALRELHEEAGIPAQAVLPLKGYEYTPLDIDVHDIDANPEKDEPGHQHVDFRFIFSLDKPHRVILQPEEVTGHEWRPLDEVSAPTIRAKLASLQLARRT